ncbi:10196_t:CDS:2 [Funneliformis caledonium]|uniref:10196_t:CDS:1 n=1 Tax=Funneliformis caledonium TaxID=1117310 RepID=A0A9N9GNP6_9GLOM|nr:10196_t:CDS:2 [Funneliformis caledonium]
MRCSSNGATTNGATTINGNNGNASKVSNNLVIPFVPSVISAVGFTASSFYGIHSLIMAQTTSFEAEVRGEIKENKEEIKIFKEEIKAEIKESKEEIKKFKAEVKAEIKESKEEIKKFKEEVKVEIKEFKEEMKEEIKAMSSKLDKIIMEFAFLRGSLKIDEKK